MKRNTKRLRTYVSLLMKERGWDYWGSRVHLAKILGVNEKSLIMALSGYRETKKSEQILFKIEEYLLKKETRRTAARG